MRRVKGKLCRNRKGQFTRCRGRASASGGSRRRKGSKSRCRFGVSKTTGRCLKNKRRR